MEQGTGLIKLLLLVGDRFKQTLLSPEFVSTYLLNQWPPLSLHKFVPTTKVFVFQI